MAKGSIAKEQITNKILEIFPNAFIYGGKELRIPIEENGEIVEIKVALTCAKVNVGNATESEQAPPSTSPVSDMPTEEEIANVKNLMERLGL